MNASLAQKSLASLSIWSASFCCPYVFPNATRRERNFSQQGKCFFCQFLCLLQRGKQMEERSSGSLKEEFNLFLTVQAGGFKKIFK